MGPSGRGDQAAAGHHAHEAAAAGLFRELPVEGMTFMSLPFRIKAPT
jgi:hypothetical protein